jgi:hypothetical protein
VRRRVEDEPLRVVRGSSVIAPLRIDGLPAEVETLGRHWLRKVEFHLTAVPAALIERLGKRSVDAWDLVADVANGRSIGPVFARDEVRTVLHPTEPGLRTVIVMADAEAISSLYEDLSDAFAQTLHPPPTHITLYSTDPERGIGIDDPRQLAERAPALPLQDQDEFRRATSFDEVFPAG